jgi:hypothetical protein
MSREKLKSIWLQLPAWGALLLGFGALLGPEARADQSRIQRSPESQSAKRPAAQSDEVTIRLDGETIYVSQGGSRFEELRVGNTLEAAHLRKLLRDAGAVGQSVSVPIGSMIVASGGGSGKGWKPKQQTSKATGDTGRIK